MPHGTPPLAHVAHVDYATLLAAVTVGSSKEAQAKRREACKRILAQVYRVVAGVLGPDAPDTGDATQDAFMRVHNAIHGFKYDPEKPASPTAWINVIALRTALDRRRTEPREDDGPLEDIEQDAPLDLDEAIDRDKLVTALFAQLDEQHRAVLILRHWSGQTDEEISRTLGIPLGTVKTRARTARIKLERYARDRLHLKHLPGDAAEGIER